MRAAPIGPRVRVPKLPRNACVSSRFQNRVQRLLVPTAPRALFLRACYDVEVYTPRSLTSRPASAGLSRRDGLALWELADSSAARQAEHNGPSKPSRALRARKADMNLSRRIKLRCSCARLWRFVLIQDDLVQSLLFSLQSIEFVNRARLFLSGRPSPAPLLDQRVAARKVL